MQHRVAVGADDGQVLQPRHTRTFPTPQRFPMVNVGEVTANLAVGREEVQPALLTRQPPVVFRLVICQLGVPQLPFSEAVTPKGHRDAALDSRDSIAVVRVVGVQVTPPESFQLFDARLDSDAGTLGGPVRGRQFALLQLGQRQGVIERRDKDASKANFDVSGGPSLCGTFFVPVRSWALIT